METSNSNQEHYKLREQIASAAASAFDMRRASDTLRACEQLFAQRNYLAYLIDKGLIKYDNLAIEQFKHFNELIKKYLSL